MPRAGGEPRWSEPGLLVLWSLAGGPKHGHAILRDLEEGMGETLGPGTLYGAIARLEERGLVEALAGDERRRPYRLTGRGLAVLEEESGRMARFSTSAASRLRSAEAAS